VNYVLRQMSIRRDTRYEVNVTLLRIIFRLTYFRARKYSMWIYVRLHCNAYIFDRRLLLLLFYRGHSKTRERKGIGVAQSVPVNNLGGVTKGKSTRMRETWRFIRELE